MTRIPPGPLWLGLAGLLPFFAAVAANFVPIVVNGDVPIDGNLILLRYGTVILAFMSGVLWGFAASAKTPRWEFYALSTLPALYVFLAATAHDLSWFPSDIDSLTALVIGFPALLGLDWIFFRAGLTPPWWMTLRVLLTAIVTACLIVGLS